MTDRTLTATGPRWMPAHWQYAAERAAAAGIRVTPTFPGEFEATSGSDPAKRYRVTIDGDEIRCDCTAGSFGRICAHKGALAALWGIVRP